MSIYLSNTNPTNYQTVPEIEIVVTPRTGLYHMFSNPKISRFSRGRIERLTRNGNYLVKAGVYTNYLTVFITRKLE